MANSAFTPSVLTIGGTSSATSGEKNYILSPDDNNSSRWVSSDVLKVTIATSSSTIPDNITKTTSLAFTRVSATDGYARYRFTMDQADYSKKFKIQWDQIYGTAAHWTLQVYSNTAADYTGTSTALTVQTSAVPGITGTFTTSVDMPGSSAPYIEVRVVASSTSATTIYFNNFTVGPGTIVQGAAVSEWQSYTPTGSWTANTTYTGRYRRVGSQAQILINVALSGAPTAATFSMTMAQILNGLNLTFNSSALPFTVTSTYPKAIIGTWHGTDNTSDYAGDVYISIINAATPTAYLGMQITSSSTTTAISNTVPITWGTNQNIAIELTLPISEWSGSGTVNLGPGASVEYAWNSSASTTLGDTTSFAYGPGGKKIEAITVALARRVRFQYPIQSDDLIIVEVSEDGLKWVPTNGGYITNTAITFSFEGYQIQNGTTYGIGRVSIVNSTDVDVYFGTYARASSTYGAAGDAWSTNAGNFYWRVRKAKASSPVGFGLVNANDSGLLRSYTAMSKIRLHTGNGYGSTPNTKIRRFSTSVVNTGTGVTYADSATLGASFTINEAGIYAIHYADCFSAASGMGLSLNSSQLTTGIQSITTADRLIMTSTSGSSAANVVSVTLALSINDVIRPHTAGDAESGAPERVSFTIQRIA